MDVGQGDGAVLITPEQDTSERIIVIDAGQTPDMLKFLDGRFHAYRKGFQFAAAVLTHPDKDHYYGFKDLFGSAFSRGQEMIWPATGRPEPRE